MDIKEVQAVEEEEGFQRHLEIEEVSIITKVRMGFSTDSSMEMIRMMRVNWDKTYMMWITRKLH